ncbi:MAG: hypothetical protein H6693_07185 [Candidatus Latescibacteria bacterium]|nr:hypothetical protein [bacterium]MCB9515963.1 hypothetical protein [Candidatus Latescibacterota bacterium]
MKPTLYIAVIGDLVGSRRLGDDARFGLQDRMQKRFSALRTAGSPGIAARPLITIGDEFQGLFANEAAGYSALLTLMRDLVELSRPVAVRFGLGLGTLSTAMRPDALGMDGPCFHNARAALEDTRKRDLLCQLRTPGGEARLWSTLASFALRQRERWSSAQCEAILLFETGLNWKQVASELGISRSAVSLRQKAAGYALFSEAWEILERELGNVNRGDRSEA